MYLIDLETERCGKIIRLYPENKIAVDFLWGDVKFIPFGKLKHGYMNGRYIMINNTVVHTRRRR